MAMTRKCRTFYRSGPKKGRCKKWGPWRKKPKFKRSSTSKKKRVLKARKKGGRKCTWYGLVKTVRGPRWACARRSGRKHSGAKSPNWMGTPITVERYKQMRREQKAAKKAAKASGSPPPPSTPFKVTNPWPFTNVYETVGAGMSARQKAQARKAAQGIRF